jgi:ABC-type uncharacterized transport system fused permease/ATPase subunit
MAQWQSWQTFWRVAKPYWVSSERWSAIALLSGMVILASGSSGLIVLETLQRGEVVSALVSGQLDRFGVAVGRFGIILAVMIPALALKNYLQSRLALQWRRWLTQRFLSQYFQEQAFYQLEHNPNIANKKPFEKSKMPRELSSSSIDSRGTNSQSPPILGDLGGKCGDSATSQTESTGASNGIGNLLIDNPDQRLAQDIQLFTQQSLLFLVLLFDASLQLLGFVGILWQVSRLLLGLLLGYVAIGTLLTNGVFGRALVALNQEQLQREADLRYGLARVRENAEAIAFYQGERSEFEQIWQRFRGVFQTVKRLIRWQFNLTMFQNAYQYLTFLLPFVVLAPSIFSGSLEVGAVTQSQAAFERLGAIFGLIILQFDKLSAFGASVQRLDQLAIALQQIHHPDRHKSQIQTLPAANLQLQHLTLLRPTATPAPPLLQDLTLTLTPPNSLLIMGASGLGKTTLLRAIAGLWRTGSGTIARPERSQLFFLPQRPYLMLGSLRQLLLYPHADAAISDSDLLEVLARVNLSHLAAHGLDSVEDWARRLSGGEQQRLAFARLWLAKPRYALLDEATSALDAAHEAHLYHQLRTLNCGIISVGHRPSLIPYHQHLLHLSGGGRWQLSPIPVSPCPSDLATGNS